LLETCAKKEIQAKIRLFSQCDTASAEPKTMKADIHPEYKPVVFQDVSSNFAILTRSTMTSKDKIKWEDGQEYPVVKIEISSASHPFYTGKHKIVDSGGRVDKFRKRYGAK